MTHNEHDANIAIAAQADRRHELLIEIANCTAAIRAFRMSCPWLAPDGLSAAPSIDWLMMQQRVCRRIRARIT
jgi:hypothetical protein